MMQKVNRTEIFKTNLESTQQLVNNIGMMPLKRNSEQ